MKKLFILFSFVYLLPSLINASTWWDNATYSNDYGYNDSIDFPAIQRIIEQEINHLFQPHEQTTINRNYIIEIREYARKEISKTIKNTCSTHTEAKRQAVRLTEEFAIDVVVDWAAYIARDLLKNPPVNPMYINVQEIIKAVKQIIRSQAQLALREKDRRLTKMVKNLVENVRVIIDQEIKYALAW